MTQPRSQRLLAPSEREQPALALAVWPCAQPTPATPVQTIRLRLIARTIRHYTDPDDLVLLHECGSEELAQAHAFHRRALELTLNHNLSVLPVGAALIITTQPTAGESIASLASTCNALLKPGGFFALLPPRPQVELGDTVRACQDAGLLYWQHVIALTAPIADGKLHHQPGTRGHHDLLIFRKKAASSVLARAAA